ncbi:hypothetical protein [Mucilaginibacter antarcticus]|uniref:hypothetical protein n=1 Tax=Mucilaginibacter antarcticus TaxID=1855725 RepID=UPI00363592FF
MTTPAVLLADQLPKVAYFNIPKGRSILSQTAISKLGNAKGVVAINFVIGKQGKVLSAKVDNANTSVKDKTFVSKVVKAVLATRFNTYWAGPETQNGSLAYVFN